MDVRRPDWWKYPADCQLGRPLGPELVPAEWQECDCPPAQATVGRGHLVIRCGTDRCRETWVQPAHRPDPITVYHRPVY